jgi:hypothetical protein
VASDKAEKKATKKVEMGLFIDCRVFSIAMKHVRFACRVQKCVGGTETRQFGTSLPNPPFSFAKHNLNVIFFCFGAS